MSDFSGPSRPDSPTAGQIDPAEPQHDGPAPEQEAAGELRFRASGGRSGVAPGARIAGQRRAIGSTLARRAAVHRKATGGGAGGAAQIPAGSGAALSSDLRARMEPKLGADLSAVRVHTGGDSQRAAGDMAARAFTVGNDVHFNAGEYQPGTKEGDKLLAHELTHVVQGQRSGIQRKAEAGEHAAEGGHGAGGLEVSHPDEPAEKEADAVADHVVGDKKSHGAGGDKAAGDKAGGEKAAGEKAPPIAAKLIGAGRKIFRTQQPAAAPAGKPPPPAAENPKAKLRKKIEKEKQDIAAASSLAAIGGVLAGTAKKGQAPQKLSNTVAGVQRARGFFDAQKDSARKDAFVDSRMAPAIADQKSGIGKAQDAMLQKPDDALDEVDYDGAQWTATQSGPQKGIYLAPENLGQSDVDQTKAAVKAQGGMVKVFSLAMMWGNMNDQLKALWTRNAGDEPKARAAWIADSTAKGEPTIVPTKFQNGLTDRDFKKFAGNMAAAYSGTVSGAMGMVDDAKDVDSFDKAVKKFALNADRYEGKVMFLTKIVGGGIDKALEAAAGGPGKDQTKNMGKPSVYTSLLFAEFNYIVEDRATNTTGGDGKNSGVVDPAGKAEVAVTAIPCSEFFGGNMTLLRG